MEQTVWNFVLNVDTVGYTIFVSSFLHQYVSDYQYPFTNMDPIVFIGDWQPV